MSETETSPVFSVSEFTTWNLSFEEDVALYQRLGVRGIEVCQRKLATDDAAARRQLELVREAGLRVTSVQPRVHALYRDGMCPDLIDPVERMRRYRGTIALFSAAFPGENLSLVTISGGAPNQNFRDAWRTARKEYRELAGYAADHGVRVMFEPLSPILMNIDTFICTLDDAVRLIEEVDRPASFGLMLDVWHVWREPEICPRIAALGPKIFGVHVCDWPADEPRGVGDRVLPGDGAIDLPGMLGAIEAAGYRGAYCLEIFSSEELPDSLWRQDPAAVIARGREGFMDAWQMRSEA